MAPTTEPAGAEAADTTTAATAASGDAAEGEGLVKVELEDPEKAAAEAAEAAEEAADYGGPGGEDPPPPPQAAGPQRSMPDYGDLIDDADSGRPPPVRGDVKTEAGVTAAKAEPRPTAIHIHGVQRLTRSHLEEVYAAKGLPCFVRVDWISDEQVLCIFRSAEEAANVLAGLRTGFGDAVTADDSPPGPGLWRAQRCMMEFREATTADVPDPMNRRLHRAGRQVREYRFWEAMKDQTRTILANEDAKGLKRPAPSGEDAIAAAEWDDFGIPEGKRRRVGQAVMTEEETIDMLEEMAKQDKVILTKTEEGEIQASKTSNDVSLVNPPIEETWTGGRWWERGGNWGGNWRREDNSGRRGRGGWQHDDRGGNWQGGGGSWGSWGDSRKRARGGGGQWKAAGEVLGVAPVAEADEEERAKRARRDERFGTSKG